jgi:hypothetical protein
VTYNGYNCIVSQFVSLASHQVHLEAVLDKKGARVSPSTLRVKRH